MFITIAVTFCLIATLFLITPNPTKSQSSTKQYNPLYDLNDDGKIDILDAIILSNYFGTSGTPINKTAWLDLQLQMNALNITIPEVEQVLEYINYNNWYNGLVGYWRFDEGNGSTVYDSSGQGNNGTVYGASWINDTINGKDGTALSFDGVDDYVMISDSQSLRVQNFTLEAWIYMTKRPYQHGDVSSAIIDKIDFLGGSGTTGYKLMFEGPSSSDDRLTISIGDGITQRFLIFYNSINDLTLNQWHNVVGTYDGTTATIYIDGELKASSSPVSFTVINDNAPLGIGQEVTAIPNGPGHFNGLIDNVMIYNRTLSAEEVMAHYLLPPP